MALWRGLQHAELDDRHPFLLLYGDYSRVKRSLDELLSRLADVASDGLDNTMPPRESVANLQTPFIVYDRLHVRLSIDPPAVLIFKLIF